MIFNIGLNRAGTTSLAEALNILGYRTLHHKYQGVRLHDIIMKNIKQNLRLFSGLDDEYEAFSDFAGQHFFTLLDQQYPGSRFILTIRDLDDWLDSRVRKVQKNNASPKYRYFFRKIDREGWAREREEYLDLVTAYFLDRKDDFLILNIPQGDGWEQLCPFLGCAIPDTPFPYLNRSENSP